MSCIPKMSSPRVLSDCVSCIADALSPRDLLALAETDAANRDALKPLLDAQWTTLCEDASALWSTLPFLRESKRKLCRAILKVPDPEEDDDNLDFYESLDRARDALWARMPANFKDRVDQFHLDADPEFLKYEVSYTLRERVGGEDVEVRHMFGIMDWYNDGGETHVWTDGIGIDDARKEVEVFRAGRLHGVGALLHWGYHGSFPELPEAPDDALWVRFARRRLLGNPTTFPLQLLNL